MKLNRREFLGRSLALGAAAGLPLGAIAAETKTPASTNKAAATPAAAPAPTGAIRRANDIIELGPTKIKVSRMGIGTGTYGAGHDSNQLRGLGVNGVADMLIAAYEKGIVLWDTADAYGTHDAVKIALKKVPREKVIISTKTDAWDGPKTQADIDRFLKEFGTDYIDILLLHTRLSPTWDKEDKAGMDVMSAAKEKKIIRAVGMSCHSIEAMQVAAKNPWLDICMVRMNNDGNRMDDQPSVVMPVVAQLKAAGKGVFGIKVLGEGALADSAKGGSEMAAGTSKSHDEALRFALTKSGLDCFSIGCETQANLIDNIDRISKLAIPL